MLSSRLGTQKETRNLDKSDSAMLSALPPGSSTPLCSHLLQSGFIYLVKATKITLKSDSLQITFCLWYRVKKRFASPRKFLIRRVEYLVCVTLLSCKIKYSSQASFSLTLIYICMRYKLEKRLRSI